MDDIYKPLCRLNYPISTIIWWTRIFQNKKNEEDDEIVIILFDALTVYCCMSIYVSALCQKKKWISKFFIIKWNVK
jgi:hypothetical protein